jgi:hypothetical protein
MKQVELYARVRYAVKIRGVSRWEASRVYGLSNLPVQANQYVS